MGVVSNYTSLNTMSGGAMLIQKYSTELRRRAIARDIYVNLRAPNIIYNNQQLAIPNGIYTKISASDQNGANSIRVSMKLEINANIIRGNGIAVGTEVGPNVRTATLYRNNYRFVIQDAPGYGEHKLDAEPYRLYEEHVKDLSPHAAAEEGLEIRMALIESNGWNLQAGSTVNVCPAQWNKNFFVAGVPLTQQPQFHTNYATYTTRIVAAIDTASGGRGRFTQTASQMLSGKIMDQLVRYAFDRRMFPLQIEGSDAFVLTISQLQAARFSNPKFTDTLGDRWCSINRLNSEKVQNWYGALGAWRSAAGATIYVVVDDRLATLLPSGSSAPYGLSANYMWPTHNDLRLLSNEHIRDASILHGAGAIVNLEPEKMHLIADSYDYELRNGKGYAGVRGIQQLQFDTTPVDGGGHGREYGGSAVVVLGRSEDN